MSLLDYYLKEIANNLSKEIDEQIINKMRTLTEINPILKDSSGRFKHGVLKELSEMTGYDYHIIANVLHRRNIAPKSGVIKSNIQMAADELALKLEKKLEIEQQINELKKQL